MGQYLDLIRQLGLDDPEAWKPPPLPAAPAPVPDFRATNQFDPMTGQPVVTALPAVTPEPLTGWRRTADQAIHAVVGTVKGATGMGDQGPAGPSWTNFGALAAAVPLSVPDAFLGAIAKKLPRFAAALQAYRAPTEAGQLAAPFYSRLDEAVGGLPKSFGAGALTKGGASAEELAIRQVPEFLAQQGTRPIAKPALEAHLAAHPLPGLEVKTLGGPPADLVAAKKVVDSRVSTMRAAAFDEPRDWVGVSDLDRTNAHWWALEAAGGDARALRKLQEIAVDPDHLETLLAFGRARRDATTLARELEKFPAPKFAPYQLPGGANYRETLITLKDQPHNSYEAFIGQMGQKYGVGYDTAALTPDEQTMQSMLWDRSQRGAAGMTENQFRSSHYPGDPNILAHSRSNERTIPGWGKGTFLEEGQSDWHQTGKEEGYLASAPTKGWTAKDSGGGFFKVYDQHGQLAGEHRAASATDAIAAAGQNMGTGGVPDAPFKDTWPDLLLKHHLADAAQNPETQWLGFTSGQTQIDRWGSERLTWTPAEGGGYHVTFEPQVAGNALGGDLGAQALAAGHIRNETRVVRSEAGLQQLVSGSKVKAAKAWKRIQGTPEGGTYLPRKEGMEAFYDDLLPKRLEKIVKPYGGTVERIDLPQPLYDTATQTKNLKERVPIWVLRLTPELKQRILRYGLPLLTGVAAVEAGTHAEPVTAGVD